MQMQMQTVKSTFSSLFAQDRDARHAYRSAGGTDAAQADLVLWHQLEERNPELFGRMHHVSESPPSSAKLICACSSV